MRVGIHDRLFVKNVCAIGLSAGFIEPLESNGLLSVHEFLLYLVDVMTRHKANDSITQFDIDSYNISHHSLFVNPMCLILVDINLDFLKYN